MAYTIYKLSFGTGIHAGTDAGGNTLSQSRLTIHSDTLFAALCCNTQDDAEFDRLVGWFQSGALRISDALPYAEDQLYIPRASRKSLMQCDSQAYKSYKSTEFVPIPQKVGDPLALVEQIDFDEEYVQTRVAIDRATSGSTPYFVSVRQFLKGKGLYVIVQYQDEEMLVLFEQTLRMLGLNGVGGKISSGLGKFDFQRCAVPDALVHMLEDDSAPEQMLLGVALPDDEELEQVLCDASYKLVRRGGYVFPTVNAQTQVRKKSLYMLSPGSCVKQRFYGQLRDVGMQSEHPVWRLASSLFVGLTAPV